MTTTPAIAIVTDSSACLSGGVIEGVEVLPLRIAIDDDPLPPAQAMTPDAVLDAIRASRRVTTSQPAPATFDAVYRRLVDEGASAIVSIHLAGRLSGTCVAAQAAAARASVPVTVLDSGTAGMALGYAVLAAAAAAKAGADADDVVAAAQSRLAATRLWLALESTAQLRAGGRLAASGAEIASADGVALFSLHDGALDLVENVPSVSGARETLIDRVLDHLRSLPARADVTIHAADRAAEGAELLAEIERRAEGRIAHGQCAPVDAVLAVHTGPSVVAAVVAPSIE